ncbi:MAG: putative peptidoglycan glycosyltransferase FtsW [Chloroflexota bacterium]
MTADARRGPVRWRASVPLPSPKAPLARPRTTDRPPTGSTRTGTGSTTRLPTAVAASLRAKPAERVVKGPERVRHEPDLLILIAIVALAAIGVLMTYSSSAAMIARLPGMDPFSAIVPELQFVVLGLIAMVTLSRMDYRVLRLGSVGFLAVAVVLLVIVLGPRIGPIVPIESAGAARWLKLGPLPQMHPAEIAKLALVIYLAHWMAKRGSRVGSLLHGLFPFLMIAGLVIGLVALEPDLGTTGVITLAAFTMFFVAGGSILQLAAIIPLGCVALAAYVLTNSYQMLRVKTFLDPWADRIGDGFHTVQGLYALALGGILGDGLGQSRGPGGLTLPNADNDYVFAMVGQELGLIGGLLVIGLFLFFAYRGLRVARRTADPFGMLLAVGITAWISYQAFINIGVVVNLLPVTGITLPFVSSGGTSVVVSLAAVGILLSISRETTPSGTFEDDADPDRGRRHGRPHLPGAGRAAKAGGTGR